MKSAANSRLHRTLGSFRLPLLLFSTIAFLTVQLPLYAQDNSDNWMSSIREANKASLVFISGKVTHKNGDAAPFAGTGFIVSSAGHVLTCNHVIPEYDPDVDTFQCSGSVGGRYEYSYPLTIVDSEKQGDLMLLTLPQEKTWTSVRWIAKGKLDSEIVVLGFPIDEPLLAAPGRITSVDNNGRLITNAALNHGMSGGPAFDRSGAVIGIAEGGYEEANSINLLIPISYATRLLQIADSPLLNPNPSPPASSTTSNPDVGKEDVQAKSFFIEDYYTPSGKMGDTGDVQIGKEEGRIQQFVYATEGKGPYAWEYRSTGKPSRQAGVMYLDPPNNWGMLYGGQDLRGFKSITFEARSLGGPVNVVFVVGGVSSVWDDKAARQVPNLFPDKYYIRRPDQLTTKWKRITIPLDGPPENLQRVIGVFGWMITWESNGIKALDDGMPDRSKTFTIEIRDLICTKSNPNNEEASQ